MFSDIINKMTESITVLKKRRTQLKKSITIFCKYIIDNQGSLNDVKVRIEKLEDTYNKFEKVQDEIEILCNNDADLEKEDKYKYEVQESYLMAQSCWKTISEDSFNQTMVPGEVPNTQPSGVVNNDLSTVLDKISETLSTVVGLQDKSANAANNETRLPKIELPSFDGKLQNWSKFRDLFVGLVDSKNTISDAEKLEYLQSKLIGEASLVIKHLPSNNDNYKIAWDLIKKKYDKPVLIKEYYMKLIINQPIMKSGHIDELKPFYSGICESYNALKTLFTDVTSWDPLLLVIIREKLDKNTLRLWYRTYDVDSATLKNLFEFLEKRISEFEAIYNNESNVNSSKTKGRVNKFFTVRVS